MFKHDFPYEIDYDIPKRVKTHTDIEKLHDIEHLLLNTNTPVSDIVKKHFKTTTEGITNENTALRNKVSQIVSSEVRKQTNIKSEYEKGKLLICTDRKKLKSRQALNVN